MSNGVEEDNDAVLSDIEADDDPVPIHMQSQVPDTITIEKFTQLLSSLDREKQARKVAENLKEELQVSFNRLKVLTHEALKKRDEAFRKVDHLSAELAEIIKSRDQKVVEVDHHLEDVLEDVMRAKDTLRLEIQTAASMLVTGIDRISNKVRDYKNFAAGGLPRSDKHTRGLPAVTYGVITRMDEIVEELVRLVEEANKGRDEAREGLEKRNFEIAIEVSELGSLIGSLREEGETKSKEIERLEKGVVERDGRIGEFERGVEDEVMKLRRSVGENESRISSLQARMELQRVLVIDQLDFVGKIHQQMHSVIKVVDPGKSLELSESLFVAQETDVEGNIRASLAGLESIYELSRFIAEKTRALVDENRIEVKSLNETAAQLIKEKEQVGLLLRTAMSRRMSVDKSSKTNELFKVTENGLREAGIDYKFSNYITKDRDQDSGVSTTDQQDDEVYELAGALENIIKQSQLEIIDLKHIVEELREESCLLKDQLETQAKELGQCKLRVEELEESERVANENVEGLMLDIAAAEEEITRWKVAAQEEAAAGRAVEEEYTEQLAAVRLELEEANQAVIQCEKKLKFKEEMAVAAMAARDAAEMSLSLADMRSRMLREKVEELTHQLQERGSRGASRTGLTRARYMCWPWEWLGLDFVGFRNHPESQQESANEMELSEPLV